MDLNSDKTNKFAKAFAKQNSYMETAIKSLDSLNDQIVQFLLAPKSTELDVENELSAKDRETLKQSMALMRRLLSEAQARFRKMVEENKRLATRIDGSITAANEEVNALRVELEDTNRRLCEISEVSVVNEEVPVSPQNKESPGPVAMIQRCNQDAEEIANLRLENTKLTQENKELRNEIEELKSLSKIANGSDDGSRTNELKLDMIQAKQELVHAKEALQAMKGDRKRLKAEKVDLLSQMKQLYCTLEEKESELRDFIRNYEQRMRESDESIKQLAMEKEESEREKWEILKRARDAAERSVSLRTELDQKEAHIKKLEASLSEAQSQLQSQKSKPSPCPETPIRTPSMAGTPTPSEDLPPYQESSSPDPPLSAKSCKSDSGYSNHTSSPRNSSLDNLAPIGETSQSSEDLNDSIFIINIPGLPNTPDSITKKKKKKSSFSRMFGKSRTRRSIATSDPSTLEADAMQTSSPRLSVLTQDNYQEKLQTLSQARSMTPTQWRASQVLAWLEIEMNMPSYGKSCAENIKSGKVLLGLSDSELDSALGINSPLHRKKIRLAIEELRDPSLVTFSKAANVDHTWVAHRWVRDIGLAQYTSAFESHLVDGRLLNVLTKKDMEKYLGIHRKFHHASILHGIELLRRVYFDKEVLSERRVQCDTVDCDPLVWTNNRLIKWVQSIDLHEYADNLRDSGVHGAVLVLEPTFNTDAMATALGIPPSKSYVRRHLATELDSLVKPARAALDPNSKKKTATSLGRSFMRSYRGGSSNDDEDTGRSSTKRLSFRGSLGRALGKKAKQDLNTSLDGSTDKKLTSMQRSHSTDMETSQV